MPVLLNAILMLLGKAIINRVVMPRLEETVETTKSDLDDRALALVKEALLSKPLRAAKASRQKP